MPQTSGTITIDGEKYTWTSPRLLALEQFESSVGPISDSKVINSVKGRIHLASLCFREKHPNLTPGVIGTWPGSAYAELWEVISAAIPLWEGSRRPPQSDSEKKGDEAEPSPSQSPSSSSSSGSLDGSQTGPDSSA